MDVIRWKEQFFQPHRLSRRPPTPSPRRLSPATVTLYRRSRGRALSPADLIRNAAKFLRESSEAAGNWPCHADRIELGGNFMTASWDDWITVSSSITPSGPRARVCGLSLSLDLPLSLSLLCVHRLSFPPSSTSRVRSRLLAPLSIYNLITVSRIWTPIIRVPSWEINFLLNPATVSIRRRGIRAATREG